jgi:hypothetical protein
MLPRKWVSSEAACKSGLVRAPLARKEALAETGWAQFQPAPSEGQVLVWSQGVVGRQEGLGEKMQEALARS